MMSNSKPTALAVSIGDACGIVGFSRAKIYREINAGRLSVRKAGHRTLIRLTDLEAYINALPQALPTESAT